MLGIVSLVTCAAPAIGPVFGGVLKSHFPPKFIIIGFAGTVIMDAVFVTLSGNVWVVAIAANDGADAAGSYMIAFPRSMMVFAGMAVLGVILAHVPILHSPPAGNEGSQIVCPQRIGWLYDGTDMPSQEKQENYHA